MTQTRARSIVGDSPGRPSTDFYPTPPEGTKALLRVEKFDGQIWEPACGDGAMSEVLEEYGYDVMSSDLFDFGYGEVGIDFFSGHREVENIVTNPPYRLAQEFAEHALECASRKVALLLKLVFLESTGRREFFRQYPPKRIWVFSKRLSIYREGKSKGKGSGMMAFAWFVWEVGSRKTAPKVGWI